MVIATCSIELHLPANGSLKGKRSVIKSICTRVSQRFNVSIAEVDHHDLWQRATLGVSAVGTDPAYLHKLLSQVVQWIEFHRPDVELLDYRIEMM